MFFILFDIMMFEDTRIKGFEYISGNDLNNEQKKLVKQLYVKFHEETDGEREKLDNFTLLTSVSDNDIPIAFSKGGDIQTELYVDPSYRRKGIAKSLLFEACNSAFKRDERRVVFEKLWAPTLEMMKKLKKEFKEDSRIEILIDKPLFGMTENEYHPDGYVYFLKTWNYKKN